MASSPKGRLELTWTNKDQRLLAHEDDTYEWCDPADFRVAEVRLLHNEATVGDTKPAGQRAQDNLLIRGDALHALTSLAELPEFAKEYVGKVKLCYIDPPFNTGQAFSHYDDALEHSVWLTMMRDRLMQIRRLLAPDGSVWVHLDDQESHRARLVLDEVFGSDNFVCTVIWQKLYARKSNTAFSTNHDFIHVYRKSAAFSPNKLVASEEVLARYRNPDADPRGPWQSVSFSVRTDNPDRRGEYRYEVRLPSGRVVGPPPGRHWNGKLERYESLLAENLLYFGKKGDSLPRFKQFIPAEEIGLVPFTIWPRSEVGDNDEAKGHLMEMFPEINDVFQTPKPERLLARVIEIATHPGDLVMDCFAGSGTTAAAAHKLNRRWVTIESRTETVETYTIPRLRKVVADSDPGGISSVEVPKEDQVGDVDPAEAAAAAKVVAAVQKAGGFDDIDDLGEAALKDLSKVLRALAQTERRPCWSGGGGFRILDVAPSMFAVDEGRVVLAEWATGGALGEATAAQLGYEFIEEPPFCGRKGNVRLAVVDGLVNEGVVRLLVGALPEGERLVVAGTALDPAARSVLKELRPGSTMRKVPSSILEEYRAARRRRFGDGPTVLEWDEAVAAMDEVG